MATVLTNPDATITFTVKRLRFRSATQGLVMVTSGSDPDVITALTSDSTGRVSQRNNNEFELSGSGPQGNKIDLEFVVEPEDEYTAVDLVIKRITSTSEGGVAWDDLKIHNNGKKNTIAVKDHGRVPNPTQQPITYEIYMFIKRNSAGDDYPIGDIGVIDPLWTNR